MNTSTHSAKGRNPRRRPGFTLVEVLVALALSLLVVGAVLALTLVALSLYRKNRLIADSAAATRMVQEYINKELSMAVSQNKPIPIYPTYSDPAPSGPARFGTLIYRVPRGAPATVADTAVPQGVSQIDLFWPLTQEAPSPHDIFLLDALVLQDPVTHAPGIPIASATRGTDPGGHPIITVVFGMDSTGTQATIASFNNGVTSADTNQVQQNSVALIQRERRFETNHPAAGSGTPPARDELWWYENPQAAPVVITHNVDAQNRYLFAPIPNAAADEQGVGWQFTFLTEENTNYLPGSKPYFQSNFAEGLVMPKSGNPLNSTDSSGDTWTVARLSTTTTTLGTTTLESTTTLGTSTTLQSTTTYDSTTTLESTTTAGTSTTIQSTTTAGTSTTKQSTTTLGTSTTLQSTTLKSTTTKGTSTTKQSSTTLQSTTTAGTSTTNYSSTTLKSTTTAGTTLLSTTTAGTSTTLKSTTTAGTTLKSTTTAGTSTTNQSTTTVGTTLRSSTTTHPTTTIMGD